MERAGYKARPMTALRSLCKSVELLKSFEMNRSHRSLLACGAALLLTGCSESKKPSASEFEKAFPVAQSPVAAPAAKPEAATDPSIDSKFDVDFFAKETADALKKEDFPRAAAGLMELRQMQALTADQLMAANETLAKVQMQLTMAAASGDQQAQQAMEELRKVHRAARARAGLGGR